MSLALSMSSDKAVAAYAKAVAEEAVARREMRAAVDAQTVAETIWRQKEEETKVAGERLLRIAAGEI